MKTGLITGASLLAALALSGCDGLTAYDGDPNSVIATARDKGRDSGQLANGEAAIAYDPDGCQNWIIDDGVEGYSGKRFDPKSGLPVCNGLYPPGTVVGDYRDKTQGISDWIPGTSLRP